MAKDVDKYKKNSGDDDDTDAGSGGQAGSVEFHDFLGVGGESRDDQLSAAERERLLSAHHGLHEALVKKQKATREERKAMKEGKLSRENYREGLQNKSSQFPSHPILSDKAQFSGIDRQVNNLSTENLADTNDDLRNELNHQYNLVHRPENAPKFNPKPSYR